jgi:hypothetical protein
MFLSVILVVKEMVSRVFPHDWWPDELHRGLGIVAE